jgi:tRNA-splicing ligase RtcB
VRIPLNPEIKDAKLRGDSGPEGADAEVYNRLPDVVAAHGDTIRVTHMLRPLGVAMAGRDVQDLYKE